jgi:tRNA nucleotidyltransferase (CCA-adding enzyme)
MKKKSSHRGLTIITTHLNADYDALASMLAAQKLYPGSLVVFPGSQEKNLRNFFVQSMVYLFNMADIKDIDLAQVRRLVLVDTRQPRRIGKFADLLDRQDVEIHIYDHHPPMETDIQGHFQVNETLGATVSILAEIIKNKGIAITPDEATIMCLGIYEDTGSFTFPSTTEKDFSAAAFLLSRGANLNMISNLIAREISPEQIALLNELIQAATHYNINGIDIVITTLASEAYVPDFAFLVHKMVKMENLNAIFALALMENKTYVVARSRIPEVDVGAIVTEMGGGGHAFAAAASIKGKTIAQTEQKLIELLYKTIQSQTQAKHLMSSPPISVAETVSCQEANSLLTRYNINALLVTRQVDGTVRLTGCITRQVIEKALFHKLDQSPVSEFMTSELAAVDPEADLLEIQEKIIGHKQRVLPVMNGNTIVGVITRTDLLKILVQQSKLTKGGLPDPLAGPIHARTRRIANFMKERLSSRIMETLRSIGDAASAIGCDAYVVGGFVRDLFLYRANEDLDIVIEGDGIAFAKKYAELMHARIHSYAKFGTAVIIFPDGFKIDVASARLEYYKFPAALPVVEMSSIKLDLFRRDFTINTLAIQLNPDKFSTLIDFFSAQKDIKERTLRVLHNLSFVEDPTRIFRALRFEQRFGFSIGKLTSHLIENAVKSDFFKRLSGRRVFAELRHILNEDNPVPAIIRLHDFNLLKAIHPSIELNSDLIDLLNSVKKVQAWHDLLFLEESYMKWAVYFMALIHNCKDKTCDEICRRLELAQRYRELVGKERLETEQCLAGLEHRLPRTNSELYHKLVVFKTELVLYMMALSKRERVKKAISYFYTQLRSVDVAITGKDLMQMGLKPGPLYKKILQRVLEAKLNGRLENVEDERNFVRAEFLP